MSRIDELIAEHCPDGVKYSPLGEVGEFIRGNGLSKSDLRDSGTPAIHYGQIHTFYGVWADKTKSFAEPALAAKLRRAKPGDLVIATTSEDDGAVAKATAWVGGEEVAVSGDAYIYRHSLDPLYVAYFFQSEQFQSQKTRHITGTKVRRLSGESLSKILIPVPPIQIQVEIAQILDRFTRLAAELAAELATRREQYEFYRDSLLSFNNAGTPPWRWMTLGEFAEFKYGFTATAQPEGQFRFLRITDINPWGKLSSEGAKFVNDVGSASDYLVSPGDLLMARTGATFGKTMLVEEETSAVYASFLIRIRLDEQVMLPSYYWHFAQSNLYWDQANASVSNGGQPQFNANVLKKVRVPVPSIEHQVQVVNILDKLDILVNDISIGLPAEIKARRQQYEHYRDQLLSFKELAA